mgnify:CR=1 FL=1
MLLLLFSCTKEYTIDVISADINMGTVTGGGDFKSGATTEISAQPKDGYLFSHWQDQNTDNPRTITVTANATYTAYFEAQKLFTITAVAADTTQGTVSGGGQYPAGATAELTALPNEGFFFSHWNDGDTLNPRTITVAGDATYTAYFEAAARYYTITVVSDDETQGTATGSGEYMDGTEVEIMAIPNEGYTFRRWQDDNNDNPRIITVTEDATYTAYFEEGTHYYTITVLSDNETQGTVSGGGVFAEGTVIEISATPNDGFNFSHWQDENTDNPRSITVTGDATYTAYFEKVINYYTITVISINPAQGSVSGGGVFAEGTVIEISATPNDNYEFSHWQDQNTDNPRSVTVTGDATYTAFFEEIIHYYTITVLAADPTQGNVSGGGVYAEGTVIEIAATPNEGYIFSRWQDDNTDNPRSLTVTGNAAYIAYFASDPTPQMVDLGLPSGTLWADRNVGAATVFEYGNNYAWGETEPKTDFSWNTYMCLESQCGTSADPVFAAGLLDIAGSQFDVAHVQWGGSWVMPTIDQIEELLDYCSWEYVEQPSGQFVYIATGPNNNTLVFPWPGYYEGTQCHLMELMGNYWSSSRIEFSSSPNYAYTIYLPYWTYEWNYESRCFGLSVRAVSNVRSAKK